jgi:hypothetical protein
MLFAVLLSIEIAAIEVDLNGEQYDIVANSLETAHENARVFAASHRLMGSGCDSLEEQNRDRCVAALLENAIGKYVSIKSNPI